MYKLLFIIGVFLCLQASAQLPQDVLKSAWTTPNGTAREQAIGGAMGSVGGDISAATINPAGLGLYKTNEIVFSPGWQLFSNKGGYLGQNQTASSVNQFALGASGVVFTYAGMNPGVNNAFVLSVNRTADFNSHVAYQGINTYSSFSEQYVEEFAASGFDINSGMASPALDYGTRMALYTSLIDTATIGGTLQVISNAQKSGRLLQQNNLLSKGGITEIDLSLASGHSDKWYLGGTLGIPILNYTRYQTYTETDLSGNTNNDFQSFTYNEVYKTTGAGINAKLGAIFSPTKPWRIGLAIHTPTAFGLTDRISAAMTTQTENYTTLKEVGITSSELDNLSNLPPNPYTTSYRLYTPWHFLASASYIFGAGQPDPKKQRGFITADLEYITTHSPHLSAPASDDPNSSDVNPYDAVNQAIKETYKGTYSARLGGELKLNTLMIRAGGAYYSNPYTYSGVKADKLFLSTGVGYRKKALFVDMAFVMRFIRDIDVPYYLADKDNTAATIKQTGGSLVLTVGYKF